MCAKRVGRETCLTTKQQLHSTAVIWDAYDRACIMLVIQREGVGNLLMLGTLDT